jgi:hypothetical protein
LKSKVKTWNNAPILNSELGLKNPSFGLVIEIEIDESNPCFFDA